MSSRQKIVNQSFSFRFDGKFLKHCCITLCLLSLVKINHFLKINHSLVTELCADENTSAYDLRCKLVKINKWECQQKISFSSDHSEETHEVFFSRKILGTFTQKITNICQCFIRSYLNYGGIIYDEALNNLSYKRSENKKYLPVLHQMLSQLW